jgi:hypothetical protein
MDGMAAGTAAGKPNALSRAWQCSDGRALFDFDIPLSKLTLGGGGHDRQLHCYFIVVWGTPKNPVCELQNQD